MARQRLLCAKHNRFNIKRALLRLSMAAQRMSAVVNSVFVVATNCYYSEEQHKEKTYNA